MFVQEHEVHPIIFEAMPLPGFIIQLHELLSIRVVRQARVALINAICAFFISVEQPIDISPVAYDLV